MCTTRKYETVFYIDFVLKHKPKSKDNFEVSACFNSCCFFLIFVLFFLFLVF